jgi:hypothetical protein
MLWGGWIISGLVVLFLTFDGVTKIIKVAPVVEASEKLGIPPHTLLGIGIVLLACTAIYSIPQTAVLGAILLTGYLGGATAIHVRAGSGLFPIAFSIAMGVLAWAGLAPSLSLPQEDCPEQPGIAQDLAVCPFLFQIHCISEHLLRLDHAREDLLVVCEPNDGVEVLRSGVRPLRSPRFSNVTPAVWITRQTNQPALSSCSSRSASHIRARVVASVVRWRASLLNTAFIAGGRRILSWAVLS